MMQTIDDLLGGLTGGEDEKKVAHLVASLPIRLGGLEFRSPAEWRQEHVGLLELMFWR